MQRLLSLKLLSKIPRNLSNAITNTSSQTSLSLISKTNQCHPSLQQLFSVPYSTFSHSWRPQNVKFSHGVFSNPLFSKQLFANTHFKGDLSNVLVNRTVGLVRTQLGRRNFHSNFLVGSTCRSCD
ncbi:hypothetical protein RDI58_028907 [Solanum bulbocastanum]|uniref:Uncharacterized protein n=1 Tax=Solanum bulbocastanum TaxID=147425 RepID=A0AAN8SPJ5_SOLBU